MAFVKVNKELSYDDLTKMVGKNVWVEYGKQGWYIPVVDGVKTIGLINGEYFAKGEDSRFRLVNASAQYLNTKFFVTVDNANKGRELLGEALKQLKVGDVVYIEPRREWFDNTGKAIVEKITVDGIQIKPTNGKELGSWGITYRLHQAKQSKSFLGIYAWVGANSTKEKLQAEISQLEKDIVAKKLDLAEKKMALDAMETPEEKIARELAALEEKVKSEGYIPKYLVYPEKGLVIAHSACAAKSRVATAWCNPTDVFHEESGRLLALRRAHQIAVNPRDYGIEKPKKEEVVEKAETPVKGCGTCEHRDLFMSSYPCKNCHGRKTDYSKWVAR